jgi:HSP20 family protein
VEPDLLDCAALQAWQPERQTFRSRSSTTSSIKKKGACSMKTSLPARVSNGLSNFFHRDPFASFREDMNDLIGRFAGEFDNGVTIEVPSMDLAETDSQIEIKMNVPGLKPEEVNVEVQGNTLVVTGEHKEEKEEKGKTYHRIERRSGSIQRSITLPCEVKEGQVAAECKNGVLTVVLPKAEQARTRKIPVKG